MGKSCRHEPSSTSATTTTAAATTATTTTTSKLKLIESEHEFSLKVLSSSSGANPIKKVNDKVNDQFSIEIITNSNIYNEVIHQVEI